WAFATARNQGKERFPVNPGDPAWLSELAKWLGYSPSLPEQFDFYSVDKAASAKEKTSVPPTVIESRARLKEFAAAEELHAAAITIVVKLLMGDDDYAASSRLYQTLMEPYLQGYQKEHASQLELIARAAVESVGYTL
ncbi:MAG: hypothetical protein NT023_04100, partial [Armatimonadetes bacterium]|nr:hypothetical protein [Armatimonadota bacterium]